MTSDRVSSNDRTPAGEPRRITKARPTITSGRRRGDPRCGDSGRRERREGVTPKRDVGVGAVSESKAVEIAAPSGAGLDAFLPKPWKATRNRRSSPAPIPGTERHHPKKNESARVVRRPQRSDASDRWSVARLRSRHCIGHGARHDDGHRSSTGQQGVERRRDVVSGSCSRKVASRSAASSDRILARRTTPALPVPPAGRWMP